MGDRLPFPVTTRTTRLTGGTIGRSNGRRTATAWTQNDRHLTYWRVFPDATANDKLRFPASNLPIEMPFSDCSTTRGLPP